MRKQRPGKLGSRCLAEFSPSGVRRDHLGHIPQFQFLFDCNDPQVCEFAGVRAQDRRTEDVTAAMRDQLDHSFGRSLGLGAIICRKAPQYLDVGMARGANQLIAPYLRRRAADKEEEFNMRTECEATKRRGKTSIAGRSPCPGISGVIFRPLEPLPPHLHYFR